MALQLSDVDGGGTVFPIVGRVIVPTKGSVVFWYNLNNDGTINKYTLHGGCPTLYGIKYGEYMKLVKFIYIYIYTPEYQNR